MLEKTLEHRYCYMLVGKVLKPIVNGQVNVSSRFIQKLKEFKTFPIVKDKKTVGYKSGYDLLRSRIAVMFDEGREYYEAMRKHGQLDYVIETLKEKPPTWNYNRLIISLFNPIIDLHKSRAPTPPCLITLGFYPHKDKLDLVGTFRAQYMDMKGLGNLYGLAMLLRHVCKSTEHFIPRHLYMVAQKAILAYHNSIGKDFLNYLR